jgi:hypothetical protein
MQQILTLHPQNITSKLFCEYLVGSSFLDMIGNFSGKLEANLEQYLPSTTLQSLTELLQGQVSNFNGLCGDTIDIFLDHMDVEVHENFSDGRICQSREF